MRTTPSRFAAYAAPTGSGGSGGSGSASGNSESPAPTDHAATELSVLERDYPEVIRALTLLWGYPEMNQYFEKAWSGQDSSLNLDPTAMSELMTLAAVHRHVCPFNPAVQVDDIYGDGRRGSAWQPARPKR